MFDIQDIKDIKKSARVAQLDRIDECIKLAEISANKEEIIKNLKEWNKSVIKVFNEKDKER